MQGSKRDVAPFKGRQHAQREVVATTHASIDRHALLRVTASPCMTIQPHLHMYIFLAGCPQQRSLRARATHTQRAPSVALAKPLGCPPQNVVNNKTQCLTLRHNKSQRVQPTRRERLTFMQKKNCSATPWFSLFRCTVRSVFCSRPCCFFVELRAAGFLRIALRASA